MKKKITKFMRGIGITVTACMVMAGDVNYAAFGTAAVLAQAGVNKNPAAVEAGKGGKIVNKTGNEKTGADKAEDGKLGVVKAENGVTPGSKAGNSTGAGNTENSTGNSSPEADKPETDKIVQNKPDNSGDVKADQNKPNDSGDEKIDQNKPNNSGDEKAGQNKPDNSGDEKIDQNKPDNSGNEKIDQNKPDNPENDKTGTDKADDNKPGKPEDDKAGTDNPGDDKTGTGNPEDDKAGTDNPKDDNAGADNPENDKPGTDNPEDDKPGNDKADGEEKEEVKLKKPSIRAASRTNGRIKIRWGKVDGAAEYVLMRSTDKNGGFRKIFQTKKESRFIDQNCTPGQVYYYQLTAYTKGRTKRADSKIKKGYSLEKAELSAVSNLAGSRKLSLSWGRVKGASGYQVFRKGGTGKYTQVATVKGKNRTFTDKGLNGGETYTYKVRAIDKNGGWGNLSNASGQMAIDAGRRMIALTYDDGPSLYTPIVLDALEKYGAHATFFVVGNRVNQFGSSIRREAALGCEIGNHTYGHSNLGSMNAAQIQSALSATNRVVKNQCGMDIHIMRPPGGSYNSTVCSAAGMPAIMWSIDTLDWKTRNTAETIACVKQKAYDGAVVLMHDLHKPTADAADTVIRDLKAAGYQMVTVSELAYYRGGMAAGKVYSQFRR